MEDYDNSIIAAAKKLGAEVEIFQSNIEEEIVNKLYEGESRGINGAILNPPVSPSDTEVSRWL